MKLYNSKTNKYEEKPSHIAKHLLKWRHISNGGQYCLPGEMQDLLHVPPAPPAAEKAAKEVPNTPIAPPKATEEAKGESKEGPKGK
jgi:hypothetical protein